MVKLILNLFRARNNQQNDNRKECGEIGEDELMKKLSKDKECQNRINVQKIEREEIHRERLREQKQLVKELRTVGVKVSSAWDLLEKSKRNSVAIPILQKHLKKNYSKHTKEGIIRSLGIKEVSNSGSVESLLECFESEENEELRWTIGTSLSIVVSEKEHVEKIVELLKEKKYEGARSQLPHCYAKHYKSKAIPLLIELLDDRTVVAETLVALGKLKAIEAKDKIEVLTKDKDSWIRGKAKAALKKIEKSQVKYDTSKKTPVDKKIMHERHEASMGFDLEDVESFLEKLNVRFKLSLDVKTLLDFTCFMEVEDEQHMIVDIGKGAEKSKMEYRVFMDDVDAPDLYLFFESEELATQVGDFMLEWAETRGM